MKIVAISDTHSLHREIDVPDGDILVHAGDITRAGEMDTIRDFAEWMASLPHAHKIVIGGNHDFALDISSTKFDPAARRALEDRGIHYLQDDAHTIKLPWSLPLKIYGAPWVPNLATWAFYDRNRDRFVDAPTNIDVLVTHGPPMGIRDGTTVPRMYRGHVVGMDDAHVGSRALLRYVERCPRLKLHIFGHVHEGYGRSDLGAVTFVNASSLSRVRADETVSAHMPIVIEMNDATRDVAPDQLE